MKHAAIQILLLLLIGCLVALVARRFKVPYTLALVVAGVLLGFVEVEELEVFHLTSEVLFTFLLPALLFEAAFTQELISLGEADTLARRDEVAAFFGWGAGAGSQSAAA